jgi:hypothetical protein
VKVARTVRRGADGKGPQRYLASRLPDQFTSPQYRDRLAAAGVQISLHQALGYQTPGSVYRGDVPRADGENRECG